MAITRKSIRDIFPEATDENVSAILTLFHTEIDSVKDELESTKSDLTKANDAKAKAEKDLADFKESTTAKETRSAKAEAFKKILSEAGVGEKHQKLIIKATDIDAIKLDKDGAIESKDSLVESVKKDYADYIIKDNQQGAHVDNPPGNGGKSKMTKEEIFAIKDTAERQKAIIENREVFGI